MVKTIINFKNYLLNKSNQYRYYKSHYASLKQDIVKLESNLKDLKIRLDEKSSVNASLKQDIVKLKKEIAALTHGYPPGHFYSPINDIDFLKSKEDEIWKPELIEGIELREKEQLNLFKLIVKYYPEFPFESKQPNLRYYPGNNMYGIGSAILLYSMIRVLKPNKIIEVGSGFSSALMMDVNDLFFEKEIELTFIEPYPERLYSLMSEEDKTRNEVIDKIVQDVNLEKYKELEPNDILFIDSSHVVKTGSDVQHIIFKILPVLKSGVYIHFHDIFYPFEYPKNWVINRKWSWNEDYFLRAFLMYNNQFQIALSTKYLYEYHDEVDYKGYDIGNSLWLKKV
ncbi:MAG: class I SAM-dependent methyltransferase [Methanobacteriaceae archaeon]|nr:class I SAM-dependent methyltransferase [Methanobacteriaceae archaeon]